MMRVILTDYVNQALAYAVYDKLEDGPFSGTRYQFMVFDEHCLAIPSNFESCILCQIAPPMSTDKRK